METLKRKSKRVIVGIVGAVVLVGGIIAIPLPGPGWLIVFAGLGILATEFVWAQKLLGFAKKNYDLWQKWLLRQSIIVKALIIFVTALLVIVILWMIDCYGFFNHWLHLHQNWVDSPLFRN